MSLEKSKGRMIENFRKNGDGSNLRFLTLKSLDDLEKRTGLVRHCFSTREGGVSKGIYESMDLSFKLGDDIGDVLENFDRLAAVIGVKKEMIVSTDQQHTANVISVSMSDAGKGITLPQDHFDVDGLITNEKGLALAVYFSDCVPIMFVDPVNEAIGVAHSGWRGTVKKIGKVLTQKMTEEYGTDPAELLCGIGPSICADHFEVGGEVVCEFVREFGETACFGSSGAGIITERYMKYEPEQGKEVPKAKIDLWLANRIVLEEAGVLPEHIDVAEICTYCEPELLFSHRRQGLQRGNNAGLIVMP